MPERDSERGSSRPQVSDAPPQRPPRVLGPWIATALVVGQMLGVGIFIGPPLVAGHLGNSTALLVLWLCGGVSALCGALTLAELGAMMPQSGGYYVIIRRTYGSAAAFAVGWLDVIAVFPGSIATLALALGTFQLPALFGDRFPPSVQLAGMTVPSAFLVAVVVVLVLTTINHIGIAVSGRVQMLLTGTPVFVFFTATILILSFGWGGAPALGSADQRPLGAITLASIAAAYMPVYFAYAGWDGAVYVGGEIARPGRNVPIALITGTLLVMALYFVLCFGFVTVLPIDQLAGSGEAGTAVASTLFGRPGVLAITSLILIGMLGSLNAQVLSGSRIAYAMGVDGLFPRFAGRLHRRFLTPVAALWLQAAWTVVLMTTGRVDQVLNYATSAMLIIGILMVPAIILLRHRDPNAERPYRTLFYPVPPILYVLSSLGVLVILIVQRDPSTWISVLWFGCAFLAYWAIVGRREALAADA